MGRALEHAGFTFPRGYLFGLTLSTAGSSTTFSVAAGEAVDDTFTGNMTLGSSISKTTSAWAVGTATGSLDTGTIAASTWYHVFLIKRPDTGVVDVLTSLSATSPTMPTNYTLKRRIGSMRTNGSSQWTLFSQNGDEFLWDVPLNDVLSTNPGTAAVTRFVTVPTGVKVNAIVALISSTSSTNLDGRFYASSLDVSDQASGTATANAGLLAASAGSSAVNGLTTIRTNTSAQFRTRNQASDAGTTVVINTYGWIDTRGKLF